MRDDQKRRLVSVKRQMQSPVHFACIKSIQIFHEKRLFRAVDPNGTVYADNVYLKSVFEGISCTDLIFKEGLCPKQR